MNIALKRDCDDPCKNLEISTNRKNQTHTPLGEISAPCSTPVFSHIIFYWLPFSTTDFPHHFLQNHLLHGILLPKHYWYSSVAWTMNEPLPKPGIPCSFPKPSIPVTTIPTLIERTQILFCMEMFMLEYNWLVRYHPIPNTKGSLRSVPKSCGHHKSITKPTLN